jgi:ribosomal protein S14
MAYTRRANPYNSTPFSSCCGTASMDHKGRPADHCHRCGEPMTHDDDGLAQRQREVGARRCLMCGMPRGNPAVVGNCNC